MAAPKKYDIEFMKRLYVTDQYSLRGLCKEFGPSYSHISAISSRDKWGDAKRAYRREVLEAEEKAKGEREEQAIADFKTSELSTAKEHQELVIRTGDRLGELIQSGVAAVKASDWRNLKQIVETWRQWDDQMRKNHNIDDKKDQPLVNINVLAALPSLKESKEAKSVVEA